MFKKLLENIQAREVKCLIQIHNEYPNLEPIPATENRPAYLVSRGTIRYGNTDENVVTAISVRSTAQTNEDSVEFTTVVGKLRGSTYTSLLVENLNHKLDGKFITYDSQDHEQVNLVYTSRQPADWLDRAKIEQELQTHARTRARLAPILDNWTHQSHFLIEHNVTVSLETRTKIQQFLESGLKSSDK